MGHCVAQKTLKNWPGFILMREKGRNFNLEYLGFAKYN
jgi:hypothetical protein